MLPASRNLVFNFTYFSPLGLAANQQFGTNFHRICEAQTLGNSLNIGLRAGFADDIVVKDMSHDGH